MKTTQITDYFAPPGRYTRFEELSSTPISLPISLFSAPLKERKLLQFDSADRFTYIIMGLAVLIAIVVPLLNLN